MIDHCRVMGNDSAGDAPRLVRDPQTGLMVTQSPAGVPPVTSDQIREILASPDETAEILANPDAMRAIEEHRAGRTHWGSIDDIPDEVRLLDEGDKPLIESRSGAAYTTAEAARVLGVTPDDIRAMVDRRELIGYDGLRGEGLRLPQWQFAAGGVHPWVRPLIDAYGHNGWGLLDFLTVPRVTGPAYLARLASPAGVDEVIAAALRTNPD